MHEFAICEKLVQVVLDELEKNRPGNERLKKATVAVGDMRQIVPDTLKFAYENMTRGTAAEGSELDIRAIPTRCRCPQCGWTGPPEGMVFLCPQCGSRDLEVEEGKELYLEKLEVDDDE